MWKKINLNFRHILILNFKKERAVLFVIMHKKDMREKVYSKFSFILILYKPAVSTETAFKLERKESE